MTVPNPQKAINDCLNEISAMYRTGDVTEFNLKRLQKQVDHMLNAGSAKPAECYMASCLLAYLRRDRPSVEETGRNAVRLGPTDRVVNMNVLSVISKIGNVVGTADLAEQMTLQFADDKNVLYSAIKNAMQSLSFGKVSEYVERYDKIAINDSFDALTKVRTPLTAMKIASEKFGFSDQELTNRAQSAVDWLRSQGHEIFGTALSTLLDGTFIYQLFVDQDSDACSRINFYLAEALFERFEDPGMELFTIACRPFADFEQARELHGA